MGALTLATVRSEYRWLGVEVQQITSDGTNVCTVTVNRWFVKVRVSQPLTRCDLTPRSIHGVFYIFTLISPNVLTPVSENCKPTMDGVLSKFPSPSKAKTLIKLNGRPTFSFVRMDVI